MKTLSALALIAALALTACSMQAPDTRDNAVLRQKIHTAVPASWREAVETADDISPLAMTPELREFVHAAVKGTTDRSECPVRSRFALAQLGQGRKRARSYTAHASR